MAEPAFRSPNFGHLAATDPLLAEYGARAEREAAEAAKKSSKKNKRRGATA